MNIIEKISGAISKSKQLLKNPESLSLEPEVSETDTTDSQLHILVPKYESYLRENNLFDLDDLISSVCRVFSENPNIVSQYRERFHWIMVDEYQDINYAQYRLIQLLVHLRLPILLQIMLRIQTPPLLNFVKITLPQLLPIIHLEHQSLVAICTMMEVPPTATILIIWEDQLRIS